MLSEKTSSLVSEGKAKGNNIYEMKNWNENQENKDLLGCESYSYLTSALRTGN